MDRFLRILCALISVVTSLSSVKSDPSTYLNVTYMTKEDSLNTHQFKCNEDIISVREGNDIFMTFNVTKYVSHHWCTNEQHNLATNIRHGQKGNNGDIIKTNISAVQGSGGQWVCKFYILRGVAVPPMIKFNGETYTDLQCHIHVQILYDLHLRINNGSVQSEIKDETYLYKEGDNITVSCTKPKDDNSGSIIWAYCVAGSCEELYGKKKKLSSQVILNNLTKQNNGNIVKCTLMSGGSVKGYARVVLKFSPDTPPKLFLNHTQQDNNKRIPVYRADTGQMVRADCYRKEKDGSLRWKLCERKSEQRSCQNAPLEKDKINKILTMDEKYDGATLSCVYTNKLNGTTSTSVILKTFTKTISEDSLTSSKMEFENRDKIHFTCKTKLTSQPTRIYLKVHDQTYEVKTNKKTNESIAVYEGSYIMDFQENVDVVCEIGDSMDPMARYDLNLIYIQPTTTVIIITTTPGPKEEASNQVSSDYVSSNVMMGVIVAATVLIINLIIILTRLLTRKRGGTKRESTGQYENFSNDPTTPTPPFPRDAKLEETYLNPLDVMEESPYAVSYNTANETYAQPYKPEDVKDLYSLPVPKNMRDKNQPLYSTAIPKNLRNNDDVTYASLDLKNARDKKTNAKPESHYASITEIEREKYVNVQADDGYENVFNNESYVNDKKVNGEYAEPTYCEYSVVNKKG